MSAGGAARAREIEERIDNLKATLVHLDVYPWKDWDAGRVREIVTWALDFAA